MLEDLNFLNFKDEIYLRSGECEIQTNCTLSRPKPATSVNFNPCHEKNKSCNRNRKNPDPISRAPKSMRWGHGIMAVLIIGSRCEGRGAKVNRSVALRTVTTNEHLALGYPNPTRKTSLNLTKASPHCMPLPSSSSPVAVKSYTTVQTLFLPP